MKKYILFLLFFLVVFELFAQRVIFNVKYDSFEFKIIKIKNSLLFKNRFGKDSNFSILKDTVFYFNALNGITAVNLNNVKTTKMSRVLVNPIEIEKLEDVFVDSWTSFNPFLRSPTVLSLPYKIISDTISSVKRIQDSSGNSVNRISYNFIEKNTNKPYRIMYTFYFDRKKSVWYAQVHLLYYNYGWSMINCDLDFMGQEIYFRYRTKERLTWKLKSKKLRLIRKFHWLHKLN